MNLCELVKLQYGLEVLEQKRLVVGAGSNTYALYTNAGKFILKNANVNGVNRPEKEPALCEHLLRKGLRVSEFVKNSTGAYVWSHDGAVYHMQKFVEGTTPAWHSADDALLRDAAQMLASIHVALQDYPPLPVGIGEGFFRHMTPRSAMKSYKNSFRHAKRMDDFASLEGLAIRIKIIKHFSLPKIEVNRLTCKNTHGDYFISQLICGEHGIRAVIDWTSASIHPVVWEIIRSYIYAAPECRNGELDMPAFARYVEEYLRIAPLTQYDLKMMPYVFYYQIAVCDYYHQYFHSAAANREIYLQQAALSTKMMQWFEKNADDCAAALETLGGKK